jgi:hypothetical protein
MPSHEEHKRIEPISGSEPSKADRITGGSEEQSPLKVKFDEAVAHADPSKVQRREVVAAAEPAISELKKPSPMDIVSTISTEPVKVAPTPKALAAQAADLRRQIARPRAVLIAEMEVNPSVVQNLNPADVGSMEGHLQHVDRGLQDASQLATGTVELGSGFVSNEKSPAVRFLSYLTESDKKLGSLVDEIKGLQRGEQRLTPETLFAIQIKIGFIQTELEFFTSTLNKALESTKTLMNIQI